jgi:hypothetical protein
VIEVGVTLAGVELELEFKWADARGIVRVDCQVNDDPVGLGCFPGADGLPACTASVDFPHLGYRSMMGWVQLVCSTDNTSKGTAFESDPFALFGDAPSPYCWYGLNPTLFDGPSRSVRDDLEWEAHSFLAATPLDEVMAFEPRRVVPLAGFSWGFTIVNGRVEIRPPRPLAIERWNEHAGVLRTTYQWWNFSDV